MYMIVDCFKEIVADGFNTATEAYVWMTAHFSADHIKLYRMIVKKED